MKANPYRWAGALLLFSSLVCGAQTSYSDRFFLTDSPEAFRFNPRLGVTVQPLDWLDLSGNFGLGTYGPAYGALASFRISRFHLNLAFQRSLGGSIPRTGIPMKPFGRTLTAGLTYDL